MINPTMLLRACVACMILIFLAVPVPSSAAVRHFELRIDEAVLDTALLQFSRQTGIQLIVPDALVAGRAAAPLSGRYTAAEALQALLGSTDLVFEFVDPVTALVRRPEPLRGRPATPAFGLGDYARFRDTGAIVGTEREIDNVIVTGARIPRSDTAPASPVTVLSDRDFRFSDSRTVETIINYLPQAIPDGTATTNNTGPNNGSATIDLRGFGSARTLVLLNGRRLVGSTIDTTVDVNSIPAGMLERVEVVTGAASAAYGSDALAGVVNFVLRDDYVGAELEAGYGITEYGDGEKLSISGAYGANFNRDRTNINIFFDAAKRMSIRESGRSVFSNDPMPFDGRFVPGGSTSLPGGFVPEIGNGLLLDPATLAGAERQYLLGNFPQTADGFIALTPNIRFDGSGRPLPFVEPVDRYSTTPFVFLQIPQERLVTSFRIRHDIPSSLSLFADLLYSVNQVDRALAPVAFTDLRVPENNPFITPELKAILDRREIPDADNFFDMQLRVPESGSRTRDNRREVFRVVGGVTGPLPDDWTWEAFLNAGRMDYVEREGKSALRSRVQSALGCPVPGNDLNGDFIPDRCPATPAFPDGVRINPFGTGNISADQLQFMLASDAVNRTDVSQFQTSVSAVGKALRLPAGPIGWAWGGEFRSETGTSVPDVLLRSPDIVGSSVNSPTSGSFEVLELFGEMFAPLVKDVNSGYSLDLNAAFRLADYSTVGEAFNWKLGFEWTPLPQLRLRGQVQSAIRAPNIEELFTERRQTFPRFIDPCAGATGALRAACVAVGVEADDIAGLAAGQRQIPVFQSGNPALQEERARTFTAGVVLEPLIDKNLRISLDYFEISVNDAVAILSTSETANLCLKAADPDNANCTRITRGPGSAVVEMEQFFENIAFVKREGVDLEIGYETPLPIPALGAGDGVLGLRLLGTWLLSAASRATPSSVKVECAGFISGSLCGRAFPELKTQFSAHYETERIGLNVRWEHIGAVRDAKFLVTPDSPAVNAGIRARDYFDLGVELKVSENLSLSGGVLNVTGDDPPLVESQIDARTDPATYDVIGRRYYLAARLNF